jgi:phosphate transport system substrate-binding protein
MSNKAALVALALLSCSFACGCKKRQPTETILIAGATAMRSHVNRVVKAFAAENESVNIVCEGGGSTASLIALKHGAIDIAMLSRPVAADEDDIQLRDYLVARDGLAIIVNPENPVNDVSKAQLQRVFQGEITTWKELGGGDETIVLVDRNESSNVKQSLEDLLLSGEAFKAASKMVASTAEVLAAVRSTATALGYVSLRGMAPGLKALRVNGVEMSKSTMLSGRYPLSRSFYLAVHAKPPPSAARFIAFTRSQKGQEVFAAAGLLQVF